MSALKNSLKAEGKYALEKHTKRLCNEPKMCVINCVCCIHLYRSERVRDNRWEKGGQKGKRRTGTQRGRAGENKQRERTNFMRFETFAPDICSPFCLPPSLHHPPVLCRFQSPFETHTL